MVYYDLNFTNSTDLYSITAGLNAELDGMLAGMLLFSIFIILYVAMRDYDVKIVFLADSFIVSIIAVLFWVLELISIEIAIIPLFMLGAAMLIKFFGDG